MICDTKVEKFFVLVTESCLLLGIEQLEQPAYFFIGFTPEKKLSGETEKKN